MEKPADILELPQVGGPGANPDAGPRRGGNQGFRGRGGFGGAGNIGFSLFAAGDTDKDGFITGAEFSGTFAKWFTEWDPDNIGALSEERLAGGLRASLPQQGFAGFGGAGGGRGQGGGGGLGPGGFGGGGPQPQPLTPEQVGLIRAWIDQGAK